MWSLIKNVLVLMVAILMILLMGCNEVTAKEDGANATHQAKTALQPTPQNYNTDDPAKAFDEIKSELELIPQKYSPEDAANGGYLIITKDKVTSNIKLMEQFMADSDAQEPASLTMVHFSGVDGAAENPRVTKILYNGFRFYAMEDDTRISTESKYQEFQFKALKLFEVNHHKAYVLVNDEKMDDAQYLKVLKDSQLKESVDYKVICEFKMD